MKIGVLKEGAAATAQMSDVYTRPTNVGCFSVLPRFTSGASVVRAGGGREPAADRATLDYLVSSHICGMRASSRRRTLASLLLSSLEMSDTTIYEPYLRALLGTASHFCEVVILKSRAVQAAHATHCATHCTPCRPLIGAFSGWIRTPPPTGAEGAQLPSSMQFPIREQMLRSIAKQFQEGSYLRLIDFCISHL